jgi:predicted Rdx family selenoprotein
VAALIKDTLQADAAIEPGGRGEFSIWVDGVKVAEKSRTGFPTEPSVVDSVSTALTKA